MRPARSRESKTLLGAVLVGSMLLAATAVVTTSRAAFTATTSNAQSSIASGTVNLSHTSASSVMFSATAAVPGPIDGGEKCIRVNYTGTAPSTVKMYGTVTNDGVAGDSIAPYVTTTVDIGTGTNDTGGAGFSCTGFTLSPTTIFSNAVPDADTGSLHNGTLERIRTGHANWTNGLGGWPNATNGSHMVYRVRMNLRDDNNAQGKNGYVTFTWEARSN